MYRRNIIIREEDAAVFIYRTRTEGHRISFSKLEFT
jgi:hypothetical protein